jgi:hypothetical protein
MVLSRAAASCRWAGLLLGRPPTGGPLAYHASLSAHSAAVPLASRRFFMGHTATMLNGGWGWDKTDGGKGKNGYQVVLGQNQGNVGGATGGRYRKVVSTRQPCDRILPGQAERRPVALRPMLSHGLP